MAEKLDSLRVVVEAAVSTVLSQTGWLLKLELTPEMILVALVKRVHYPVNTKVM